jgi:hypothetical protein
MRSGLLMVAEIKASCDISAIFDKASYLVTRCVTRTLWVLSADRWPKVAAHATVPRLKAFCTAASPAWQELVRVTVLYSAGGTPESFGESCDAGVQRRLG